jgi:hypothetical protein
MRTTTTQWSGVGERHVDVSDYRGQFVLARSAADLPPQWRTVAALGWHLAVNNVPIHELSHEGEFLGWCVGYPLADEPVTLDPADIDSFYQRFAGSWILILVRSGRLMLDAGGQMPAVYDTQARIVASTPTLIPSAQPRNLQFEREVGFPDRDGWFPFGLTSRPNIRRVLPSHSLDLERWTVARHWPNASTDLSIDPKVKPRVSNICELMTRTIRLASRNHSLGLSVTAGHDSRMVLACAREFISRATCFTYWTPGSESRDVHIARLLAEVGRLDHRFVAFVNANAEQMDAWLHRTGHAAAGGIMKIHPTPMCLDPGKVVVTGMGGEIGRGYYYRRGDYARQTLTPEILLSRLGLAPSAALAEAGAQWLESLEARDAFVKLDLLYVENRFGCWAAPQRFTQTAAAFQITPFNYRPLIEAMLRLPHYYRWRDHLPYDVMRFAWPALLRLPVNRYTDGWRGVKDSMIAMARATVGHIRYRGGEL